MIHHGLFFFNIHLLEISHNSFRRNISYREFDEVKGKLNARDLGERRYSCNFSKLVHKLISLCYSRKKDDSFCTK